MLLSMPAFLGFSLSPAASGRGEGPAAAAVGGGSSKAVAADFSKAESEVAEPLLLVCQNHPWEKPA